MEARRRSAPPGRQRALGRLPVPRGAGSRDCRLARAHGLGRPLPKPSAGRARIRGRGRGPCSSDLVDGPEGHRGLRDAREQRTRADRGALPLRSSLREDGGRRSPELGRPLARPVPRRGRARAPRVSGHARPDLVRAHLSGPAADTCSAARSRSWAHARIRGSRPGALSAPSPRAGGRRARWNVPVRVQRRE